MKVGAAHCKRLWGYLLAPNVQCLSHWYCALHIYSHSAIACGCSRREKIKHAQMFSWFKLVCIVSFNSLVGHLLSGAFLDKAHRLKAWDS